MPNKSGSWFRQKEGILQEKKTMQHHLLWVISWKISWMFCLPALAVLGCPAELWAGYQLPDGKTTTHILPFASESTCGCPTPHSHTKLSAIQETHKKKGGILCQAFARQGHCMHKPICQGTKPPHSSLILNKIHLQCSSDANVHCGRTNNRFVWAERFFYDLFNFKINFSLWNTY